MTHEVLVTRIRDERAVEVLEPREAVFAGIIGFAVVYPLVYYAYHVGYVFWGYSPREWKNLGTAVDVLGFAVFRTFW